jgi:hypothetical protein
MPSRNSAARLAFFAQRDHIKACLDRGEFMSEVYAQLDYPGSYAQFARYVRRHIQPVLVLVATPPPISRPVKVKNAMEEPMAAPPREPVCLHRPDLPVWNPAALDRKRVLRAADPK